MFERMAVVRPFCLRAECQASIAGLAVVHMRAVPLVELGDFFGGEREFGCGCKALPEVKAGDVAPVVGVAVYPIMLFQLFVVQSREMRWRCSRASARG